MLEPTSYKSKDEIIQKIKADLPKIIEMGVSRIGIFGSIVRNEAIKNSDIDILIEFQEGKKNYRNLLAVYSFLQDSLNSKVDLVTNEGLSPFIGPAILNEVEYIENTDWIVESY